MQINNPLMMNPFFVPARPPRQNTPAAIAAAIEKLAQSNTGLRLLEGEIQLKVYAIWPTPISTTQQPTTSKYTGGCAEHPRAKSFKSIIEINNPHDEWCMARAIVVGIEASKVKEGKRTSQQFTAFCDDNQRVQSRAAYKLQLLAGVPLDRLCGIKDLKMFQEFLDSRYEDRFRFAYFILILATRNFRLALFAKEQQCSMIWRGEKRAKHNICLLLESNHFVFIGAPKQMFNARDFCLECGKMVRPRSYHPIACPAVCRFCLRHNYPQQPCRGNEGIECEQCGFVFPNRECFEYHRQTSTRHMALIDTNDTAVVGRLMKELSIHKSLCETR
jgi:hypothetical protein